jgi:hypothetical protein
MRHRLVGDAGRAARSGSRVVPRPTFRARQQIRQNGLRGELLSRTGPTHVTRPHRPVEADQPGDAVAAEVAWPEVPSIGPLAVVRRPGVVSGTRLVAGAGPVAGTGLVAGTRQVRRARRFPPRLPGAAGMVTWWGPRMRLA